MLLLGPPPRLAKNLHGEMPAKNPQALALLLKLSDFSCGDDESLSLLN